MIDDNEEVEAKQHGDRTRLATLSDDRNGYCAENLAGSRELFQYAKPRPAKGAAGPALERPAWGGRRDEDSAGVTDRCRSKGERASA